MNAPDSPKLVLHIGAHKTGTSAIQVFLQRANAKLMEQGWIFAPQPEGPLNWGAMIGLRPTAQGAEFFLREEVFQAFLKRLKIRQRHLIASAEDLFFLEPAEIARFAEAVQPLAEDITIISYLRRQDLMALSHWAQGAKTIQSASVFGCEAGQLRPLTGQMRSYLDYAGRLAAWRAAFPAARFVTRIYERRNFPGGDVVQDFLKILGLTVEGVELPRDINAAYGTTTCQFIYWLRAQGFEQPAIRAIVERQMLEPTTDRALPSRAEVEAFLAPFAESNRRLAAELGVEHAFDLDLSDYPQEPSFQPLKPEAAADQLLALTRELVARLP